MYIREHVGFAQVVETKRDVVAGTGVKELKVLTRLLFTSLLKICVFSCPECEKLRILESPCHAFFFHIGICMLLVLHVVRLHFLSSISNLSACLKSICEWVATPTDMLPLSIVLVQITQGL